MVTDKKKMTRTRRRRRRMSPIYARILPACRRALPERREAAPFPGRTPDRQARTSAVIPVLRPASLPCSYGEACTCAAPLEAFPPEQVLWQILSPEQVLSEISLPAQAL